MEHLWSQAGATGGNRSQIEGPRKRLKQADRQPVATHGNGSGAHGKEGVNGSSPLEGFSEAPAQQRLSLSRKETFRSVGVRQSDGVIASVACEVAVVLVDNRQARAHEA